MAFLPRQPRKDNHWRYQDAPKTRTNLRAFIYFVEPGQINVDEYDRLQDLSEGTDSPELPLLQEWLETWILTGKITQVPPRRGDLIQVSWLEYRNDGLYIIDVEPRNGNLVVRDLYYYADDYGSLPPDFTLLEFPPCYFDAIDHNFYRWLPAELFNLESVEFSFPAALFVPNQNTKFDLRGMPWLKVEAHGLYFFVVGVSELEEESPQVYQEKFVKSFMKELREPLSFKGKNYVYLQSQSDLVVGQPSDPMHTLFLYCNEDYNIGCIDLSKLQIPSATGLPSLPRNNF